MGCRKGFIDVIGAVVDLELGGLDDKEYAIILLTHIFKTNTI